MSMTPHRAALRSMEASTLLSALATAAGNQRRAGLALRLPYSTYRRRLALTWHALIKGRVVYAGGLW